jgi:hypothetical protein
MVTASVGLPRGALHTLGFRIGLRICLDTSTPTPFNAAFRRRADLSLLRLRIAARDSTGFLTRSSIGLASRLILRSRLTLIRLALIRKPWSFGGRVSRPPYRYLYLHLLFQRLQCGSRRAFCAAGMLPYRCSRIPRLRPHAYARLLSMPRPSTSELLRTL